MIELRFVERMVPLNEFVATTQKILQYRDFSEEHIYYQDESREWKDVPNVGVIDENKD